VRVRFLIAGASFLLGAYLVHRFPVMYWADPYARLESRDRLLVDRWLPLLQALLDGLARVTASLTAMRLILCAIGAWAVLSGYALAACLFGRLAAALFAVLLATTPLFVALSIVPYQEVLFLGLAFTGLALHFGPDGPHRARWAAAAFNLACLTRYEGWVLVGVVALFEGRAAIRVALRHGWTALAWLLVLLLSHQAGRLTSQSASARPSFAEIWRAYFHQLRGQIGSDLLIVLSVVGVAAALATRQRLRLHAVVLSFVIASVALIFVVNPYSADNLRQTFLPLVLVLLYAASGIVVLLGRVFRGRVGLLSVAVGVAALVFAVLFTPRAVAFVQAAASEPEGRIVFAVAQRIRASSGGPPAGRIAMLSTNELQAAILATYTGVPRERIVTPTGGRLPPDTRYVVDIELPSATPVADAAAVRAQLAPAQGWHLDSAVVWPIHDADHLIRDER
jgi:hypothetical protein